MENEIKTLEVGKTYMCRTGFPVAIIRFEDGYYWSEEGIAYYEDGSIHVGGRRMEDHKLNLIIE